jgi:hypothetical protein
MDEWAALDREATVWDAMERGGADIEVRVQQYCMQCCVSSFPDPDTYRRQTKDFFGKKLK